MLSVSAAIAHKDRLTRLKKNGHTSDFAAGRNYLQGYGTQAPSQKYHPSGQGVSVSPSVALARLRDLAVLTSPLGRAVRWSAVICVEALASISISSCARWSLSSSVSPLRR